MGYRSSVESIIYGDPERIDLFVVKHKILGLDDSAFEHFKESLTVQEYEETVWGENREVAGKAKKKVIHLYGADWKWYESYDDVKAWEALLLDAEEFGLEYEFVRVGEESDDIERRSSGDDSGHLYPETYINCDLPIERN
jgi:hypothetical protein